MSLLPQAIYDHILAFKNQILPLPAIWKLYSEVENFVWKTFQHISLKYGFFVMIEGIISITLVEIGSVT